MNDEKIILIVAAAVLTAVILFRKKDIPFIDNDEPDVPITDIVGMSQTPENSNVQVGQARYIANRRAWYLPPLDNFIPSVTSGQAGQTSVKPPEFVSRWMGMLSREG